MSLYSMSSLPTVSMSSVSVWLGIVKRDVEIFEAHREVVGYGVLDAAADGPAVGPLRVAIVDIGRDRTNEAAELHLRSGEATRYVEQRVVGRPARAGP